MASGAWSRVPFADALCGEDVVALDARSAFRLAVVRVRRSPSEIAAQRPGASWNYADVAPLAYLTDVLIRPPRRVDLESTTVLRALGTGRPADACSGAASAGLAWRAGVIGATFAVHPLTFRDPP